ncbi:hypothetical protein V6N13_108657 [Hibiscus sabdariffa]|uniref:Uncharacterized protein n=1 Tax=Hibiscus sabdariffa TaxID=183260 RepID=A0ABR2SST5_9ROSI
MDTDGFATPLAVGLHGDGFTGSRDGRVDGQRQQQTENHGSGKATYASVVHKGSNTSGTMPSDLQFVEEEVVCEDLRRQAKGVGTKDSADQVTDPLQGQDPKETERLGPWMIAASRRRRTLVRDASLDKSKLVAGRSCFAALEVSDEVSVDAAVLEDTLVTRGMNMEDTQGRQQPVVVGGGFVKNATYKASNPERRSKAALGSVRSAVVIPMVAGKGVQVVDHATEVSKGRATKENLNRGLRFRRPGEMRTSLRPVLAELGQNSTGVISKGTLLEDTSFLDSVLHSSDAETMYELSDEDGRMDAEGVERPLVQ